MKFLYLQNNQFEGDKASLEEALRDLLPSKTEVYI
jgi:hypothetical protein